MSDTITERLAEIRANDDFVHSLHGRGWDDHATDAEIDRAALLAALDVALKPHEPQTTAHGVVCPRCSVAAGQLVHAPCGEVQAIAAALSRDTEEAER